MTPQNRSPALLLKFRLANAAILLFSFLTSFFVNGNGVVLFMGETGTKVFLWGIVPVGALLDLWLVFNSRTWRLYHIVGLVIYAVLFLPSFLP